MSDALLDELAVAPLFVAGIPAAEHTQMVDGAVSSLRTTFSLESYTESLAEKSTFLALPLPRAASFGEGCGFAGSTEATIVLVAK